MSINAEITKQLLPAGGSSPFSLNIHLRVASPAITVLLGPSGSGKTLTLNCIAGFARPDAGRILVNDRLYFDAASGVHLPPQLRACGYVFQDHALFPHMTVRDNLRFAGAVSPRRTAALSQRRRVNELLELFELADLAARKPAQLSGGEKQRAALARILVSEPQMILLDEPTRGLDERLRQSFYAILLEMHQRLEIPMLLVTHDMEECFQLADHVCLMGEGRFLQDGSREAVLHQPASVEAARFLGLYALVPAEIQALNPGQNSSRLRLLGQEITAAYFGGHLLGDRGTALIRLSELTVSAVPRGGLSELLLDVLRVRHDPRGVRIEFEAGLSVSVSYREYEQLGGGPRFAIQIPRSAISFLVE